MTVSGDRWLCGWRVASDLPLPDLLPWPGGGAEPECPPDITVRLGSVPDQLDAIVHHGPVLQIAADGACRFAIDGVGAFRIERGRRVTVQTELDPGSPDLRVFLLGSVFGILCHQRDLLPIHAGCVAIDGSAVALSGHSGAGKSTLTAAFRRSGHAVVADDVTVVDVNAPGGPRVLPAFPRLKLWQDAIDALGLAPEGLERVRTGLEKFSLPVGASFRTEPLPLAVIYDLRTVNDIRLAGTAAVRGIARMDVLNNAVYRRTVAVHGAGRKDFAASLMRLAAVPVERLSRVHDLAALGDTVELVAARHAAPRRDDAS